MTTKMSGISRRVSAAPIVAANYLAATIGAADTLLLIPLIFVVMGRTAAPIQAGYFQIATVVAGPPGGLPAAPLCAVFSGGSPNRAASAGRPRRVSHAVIPTRARPRPP